MIEGVISIVRQVAWIVGVPVVTIGLFIVLPILVTKNAGGMAERLSKLPGVTPEGGPRAGFAVLVYPLAAVMIVGIALTVATGAMGGGDGDVASSEGVDAGDNTDQGFDSDGADGDENGPGTDDDGGVNTDTDADGPPNEGNYSPVVDLMTIQVYEIEQYETRLLDEGTLTIYDPEENVVAEEPIVDEATNDQGAMHSIWDFTPGVNYTASVTDVDGWPSVNKSFDPADYDMRKLNITVGYDVNPVNSHRSVYIDNFTEIEDRARFLQAGYSAYAENGDAVLKTTNAEYDNDNIEGRWVSVTYTDGKANQTYHNRVDGWELAPDRKLTGFDKPTKQKYVNSNALLRGASSGTERIYLGQETLNSTGVEQTVPDEPLAERVPQVNDAREFHDGRIVDVFYFEKFTAPTTDMYIYVDVETKHVLRLEYADRATRTGDPIWVTIDYWDHGNVDSIEEYDAETLED